MRNIKYMISIILVIVIILITYIYFNKKPVESVPSRATLVFVQENLEVNEVCL